MIFIHLPSTFFPRKYPNCFSRIGALFIIHAMTHDAHPLLGCCAVIYGFIFTVVKDYNYSKRILLYDCYISLSSNPMK